MKMFNLYDNVILKTNNLECTIVDIYDDQELGRMFTLETNDEINDPEADMPGRFSLYRCSEDEFIKNDDD
jgi:hypothetical protein